MYIYETDGLLFIGDPHLSSSKPGRRVEPEHEIIHVMIDKLEQSVNIANDKNLLIVILGDLFDKARNSSDLLNTLLFKLLRKAKHIPICLAGNHDLLATEVTDDTSLAAVEATGLIRIIRKSFNIDARIKIKDKYVSLVGIMHDDEIIKDCTNIANYQKDDMTIFITHHDIAFEGAYPGSLTPFPIVGCNLVVNGHMHRTQPSIVADNTTWVNPGNIFRQTIADSKHVPAVWEWNPEMDTPVRHKLTYIEEVFVWTGKNLKLQGDSQVVFDKDDPEFVNQLQASLSGELPKTSQADILLEDITIVNDEIKPSDDVLKIINLLHKKISSP